MDWLTILQLNNLLYIFYPCIILESNALVVVIGYFGLSAISLLMDGHSRSHLVEYERRLPYGMGEAWRLRRSHVLVYACKSWDVVQGASRSRLGEKNEEG